MGKEIMKEKQLNDVSLVSKTGEILVFKLFTICSMILKL